MKVRTRKALTANKKPKRKPSGLRVDPTRTARLRKKFVMSMSRKFGGLKADILKLVIDQDAFGLLSRHRVVNAFCPTGEGGGVDPSCSSGNGGSTQTHTEASEHLTNVFRLYDAALKDKQPWDFVVRNNLTTNAPDWRFASDPEKVKLFQAWLRTQVAKRISSVTEEKLWDAYIRTAYEKGAGRAYDDASKSERAIASGRDRMDFYDGSRRQFLRDSFRQPASVERVKILAGRSFDDLKNVTTDMSTRITRSLVDGMIRGSNPREIARDMVEDVDISRGRAELIARTEIIRSHAEGQLDSLENLGMTGVGVDVEWSTSGDLRVCPDCADMENTVMSIADAHGLIPFHPGCRCAWRPSGVGETSEPVENRRRYHVHNSFCATGEGGGVDPSCSPTESSPADKAISPYGHVATRPQSEKFNDSHRKYVEYTVHAEQPTDNSFCATGEGGDGA